LRWFERVAGLPGVKAKFADTRPNVSIIAGGRPVISRITDLS
jgi:hypothetical protein